RLKLAQFLGVFPRQCVRDRRQDLGRLHQRPLEAAQRRLKLPRVAVPVEPGAEHAAAGKLRRQPADLAADLREAAQTTAQPRVLVAEAALLYVTFGHGGGNGGGGTEGPAPYSGSAQAKDSARVASPPAFSTARCG